MPFDPRSTSSARGSAAVTVSPFRDTGRTADGPISSRSTLSTS